MSPDTKAWCLFCAAVFFWMGGSLFLGASEHAGSALAWMAEGSEVPGSQRSRLASFYRLAGAAWAGFGLWFFWKTLRDPAALAAFLPRWGSHRTGRALGGCLLLLLGAALASGKVASGGRRRRGSDLEAELGLDADAETWLRRVQRVWGWGLVLTFVAFGVYLLRPATAG